MFLVAKKFNFPYKVMWTLKKTLRIKDLFYWLVIRIRILTRIDSGGCRYIYVGLFVLLDRSHGLSCYLFKSAMGRVRTVTL
jgi:hypothetical protein